MTTRRIKKKSTPKKNESPQDRLLRLADDALSCSKVAKRHKKSLTGANHYADRLSLLRAEATLAFQALGSLSLGDTSALAEMIETIFAAGSKAGDRASALRDLRFEMTTKWKDTPAAISVNIDGGVIPLEILTLTNRSYLVTIGRQVNACYATGCFDAAAVMMRRLLETSIVEAFEGKGIDDQIKDDQGQFFQLSKLIDKAMSEKWNLPKNVKKELGELRDLGHRAAHSRYTLTRKADIDKHLGVYREAVEAFLHLSGLL